jgi:hypothetical protein
MLTKTHGIIVLAGLAVFGLVVTVIITTPDENMVTYSDHYIVTDVRQIYDIHSSLIKNTSLESAGTIWDVYISQDYARVSIRLVESGEETLPHYSGQHMVPTIKRAFEIHHNLLKDAVFMTNATQWDVYVSSDNTDIYVKFRTAGYEYREFCFLAKGSKNPLKAVVNTTVDAGGKLNYLKEKVLDPNVCGATEIMCPGLTVWWTVYSTDITDLKTDSGDALSDPDRAGLNCAKQYAYHNIVYYDNTDSTMPQWVASTGAKVLWVFCAIFGLCLLVGAIMACDKWCCPGCIDEFCSKKR